ncbi:MAG TPA: substrate-binding protein [Xanthobacteraceae bacterium]|jgi:ABC-type branched-subunit amino acid transport system substrate-binding protein
MPKQPIDRNGKVAKVGIPVSRRSLVKAGLGATAAGFLLPKTTVWAKDYPALGTFPAGADSSSVFVGGVMPLTGPYSASGKDMQLGFELAIEHLNNGSRVTEQIPTLKKGNGVLGKKLAFAVADSETKPDTAVQAATRFIRDNKAIMFTGGVSSAESIAMQKLGQREHVIFMVGNSGSNDTTGKDCQRYGFRSQPSAYMAAKALAPVLAKELGKDRKAAYLVPDYTYGTSVYNSMKEFTEQVGWKTVNEQLAPLGTADFSSYLLNIANSGADVFVNVAFGADATASTKQAEQFGILSKMKYVVPNISQFQAKDLGASIMGGTYGTQAWWWSEEDTYPLAKFFVEDFQKKNNYQPDWGASEVYIQMLVWADAVERAGTFYPIEVIKALESGQKVNSIYGEVYYRADDHQLVRPVPVMVGKKPDEMKNANDFFRIVELVPGEQVLPPVSETGCKMPDINA